MNCSISNNIQCMFPDPGWSTSSILEAATWSRCWDS